MSIIKVRNLTKIYRVNAIKSGMGEYIKNLFKSKYKSITAVNDISFDIEEGQIVGYIGENGAGKSTTIKMLTGVLTPTRGNVEVDGVVPYKERIKNNLKIGAVFGQKTQLWWDLPVIESFKLIGSLYRMSNERYKENLEYIINRLDLSELLNEPVKNLSLGQKMKCEVAATFLHDPKVVYLDEPTIGLDLLVKENIREFIREINKKYNTTIIITTHDVKDVEELCSRIILVDTGSIIYDGDIAAFKAKHSTDNIAIFTKEKDSKQDVIQAITSKKIKIIHEDNNTIKVMYSPDNINIIEIIKEIEKVCKIINVENKVPELEDILKEIYRGNKNV